MDLDAHLREEICEAWGHEALEMSSFIIGYISEGSLTPYCILSTVPKYSSGALGNNDPIVNLKICKIYESICDDTEVKIYFYHCG